ncbi:hypothetical protein N0V88_007693 [Collariella sp. IMI 366227]|nr:hypothetical protein N0V88_007693 [Collariella sp. IMI 366227]
MANYSPYGSTPGHDYLYDDKFASPSPTPSPRASAYYYPPTPQRPATRAHFRNGSTTGVNPGFASPRGPSFSPRYTSDGQYATVNVSVSRAPRKQSFSGPPPRPSRERRSSFSYNYRTTVSHGESDEDEYLDLGGKTYVLPGRSTQKRYSGGHGQTARPTAASVHKKPEPAPARQATEADAKKHRIPAGYSLKNWDPSEEPIMLLGSVFDANSLGKWIYDWTIYHHGASSAISEMAGDMWLLLIQLSGKLKRAEEIMPKIRTEENREMVEEFIEAGYRLTDKLRKLAKACEAPMLRSREKPRKDSSLGKAAGVELVETLFGRDRELDLTERFLAQTRLWNLRFDTNCEEILKKPGK